jgi:hypothetical protein
MVFTPSHDVVPLTMKEGARHRFVGAAPPVSLADVKGTPPDRHRRVTASLGGVYDIGCMPGGQDRASIDAFAGLCR